MFGSYFWDRLLDIVETVTEETFWMHLIGERTFFMFKRYAGNDTILFYIFLSLIPAITEATKGFYAYCKRLKEQLFYVSVTVGDNELIFAPIDEYLTKNFKGIHELRHARGKTGYAEPSNNAYGGGYFSYYRRRTDDIQNTPMIELIPEKYREFEIKYKGYTIYINRKDEAPIGSSSMSPFLSISSMRTDTIEIRMRSRNLPKLQSFLQEWVDEYYNSRKNKLIIYKCDFGSHVWDDESRWKEHGFKRIRSFNSVVLKKGDQERILNDILTFKDSKDWYNDRGIPYRRGYLLHGPPGTGKTSFIQSLASRVKMNVAILNLAAASDDDTLSSALAQVPKSCILVIEDVDHHQFNEGVKDNSKQKKDPHEKSCVSVSGILNALDGIASLEESIIFMTCNDMNTIPPALIRPGRIDLKLHLGYADDYQAELMFWRFFCMEHKDASLEDIPKDNYPLLRDTVNELIHRLRVTARQVSTQLEISPAELLSFFIFHALKFNLSKYPDLIGKCCQSILDHIPEFIDSIAADRKQAIEHAKKNKESQQTTTDDTAVSANSTTKEIIPTPPTSPAAERNTASNVSANQEVAED